MSVKANKVVMYMDKEWLETLYTWLEYKDMDAEDGEVCQIISVEEIEVGDEYVVRYED